MSVYVSCELNSICKGLQERNAVKCTNLDYPVFSQSAIFVLFPLLPIVILTCLSRWCFNFLPIKQTHLFLDSLDDIGCNHPYHLHIFHTYRVPFLKPSFPEVTGKSAVKLCFSVGRQGKMLTFVSIPEPTASDSSIILPVPEPLPLQLMGHLFYIF